MSRRNKPSISREPAFARGLRARLTKATNQMPLKNGSDLAEAITAVLGHTKTPLEAIILIGSVTLLNESSHDVDVVAYLRKRDFNKPEQLIGSMRDAFGALGARVVREPRFIHDEQLRRIEMMVNFKGIPLDIVFTDGEPFIGNTPFTIYRDNLEVFLGNLYVYGKVLYARRNGRYQGLKRQYLMLYQTLRTGRIAAFREEFFRYVESAKAAASEGDLFKGLRAFNLSVLLYLKYAFAINNRYPLNLEKHLEVQAREILGNPKVLADLAAILAQTKLTTNSLADGTAGLACCFNRLHERHGCAA